MNYITQYRISSAFGDGSFGSVLVGRSWSGGSEYRYGFNGQEQDDEVYGNGNLNTAEFWEYDTRLGRRWNLDPYFIPWQSDYSTFNNCPLTFHDLFGSNSENPNKKSHKTGLDYRGQEGFTGLDGPVVVGSVDNLATPGSKGETSFSKLGEPYSTLPETPQNDHANTTLRRYNAANPTEDDLIDEMRKYVGKAWNGDRVVDKFVSLHNSGNQPGQIFITDVPINHIPNGEIWDDWLKGVKDEFARQYFVENRPVSNIDLTVNNPDFGAAIQDISYMIVLGNVEKTVILCNKIEVQETRNYTKYKAEMTVQLSDWFGVGIGDFANFDLATLLAEPGLACFWILQHQKGYAPFINQYNINLTFTHKVKK